MRFGFFIIAMIGTPALFICGCQPYRDVSYHRQPSPVSLEDTLQNKGAYYTVRRGDTIYRIARSYHIEPQQIIRINKLDSAGTIAVGQSLFIPRSGMATLPAGTFYQKGRSLSFIAPMKGTITVKNNEMIINPLQDASVYAAEDGRVSFVDDLRGYGSTIIIEHRDGLSTVYANLLKNQVRANTRVQKGQRIGEINSAGNSALRFQIRRGKQVLDPQKYIR